MPDIQPAATSDSSPTPIEPVPPVAPSATSDSSPTPIEPIPPVGPSATQQTVLPEGPPAPHSAQEGLPTPGIGGAGGRPVSDDEDLAGGSTNSSRVQDGANVFVAQILAIQKLRLGVAIVSSIVLLALISAMGLTVWSFTRQIEKATPEVRLAHVDTPTQTTVPTTVGVARAKADESQDTKKSITGTAKSMAATVVAGTNTSVVVDISSIGTSVVTVISILVLAITVLAIALLRSTFSLSAHRENVGSSADPEKRAESIVPMPAFEAIKAGFEAVSEVVKGIIGKK